jgi:hypothetical protein
LLVLAGLIVDLLGCATQTSRLDTRAFREAEGPVRVSLTDIKVFFKLDPRITRGMYMGERWVSPPTYAPGPQEGKDFTVEARAEGLDARGNPLYITAEWLPADPEMMTVMPGQGNEVKIILKRAGQSTLKVTSQGFSKELFIKATYRNSAMQVEISQGRD